MQRLLRSQRVLHISASARRSTVSGARCLSTSDGSKTWTWGRGATRDSGSSGFFGGFLGGSKPKDKPDVQAKAHIPARLSDLAGDVLKLEFSETNSIALGADGSVYTWGTDRYALGHGGKVTSQTLPRRVSALKGIDIVDVAIGSYHAAAVSSEGELFTWGFGGSLMQQGALGHGDSTDQPRPALVEDLEQKGVRVHAVSCGQAHTMALADDGVLWATGEGESGRLGTGVSSIASFQQVDFPQEATRCVAVSCGSDFTVAIDDFGGMWGWGKSGAGQLGLGENAALDFNACETVPQLITILDVESDEAMAAEAVQLRAGEQGCIALMADGRVYTWGSRVDLRPYEVIQGAFDGMEEDETIVQVACSTGALGALSSKGKVYTWGSNAMSGTTGRSNMTRQAQPQLLDAFEGASMKSLWMGGAAAGSVEGMAPAESGRIRPPPMLV